MTEIQIRRKNALKKLLSTIDFFYRESFIKSPETCIEEVELIIEALENAADVLNKTEIDKVHTFLDKVHSAWKKEDFVLARDYFYFAMKPYLERKIGVQINKKKF